MLNKLFNLLNHISEIISKNDNYEDTLDRIVCAMAEGLHVSVCSVYIYDDDMDRLYLAASHGLKKESVGKVTMRPGEGLTGTSFKSVKLINVKNPNQHPSFKYFKNTGEEKYKSFLSSPLLAGDKCIGILVIQRTIPYRFPAPVVKMVKSVCTQIANVVLIAKLLGTVESKLPATRTDNNHPISNNSFITLEGIAANEGYAIGNATIFMPSDYFDKVPYPTFHKNKNTEVELFKKAVAITKEETSSLEKHALTILSEADASIFLAHLLFLEDKLLLNQIEKEIVENGHTAEFSIRIIFDLYKEKFLMLKSDIFRDKVMDLKDVLLRLTHNVTLLKEPENTRTTSTTTGSGNRILVAKEILPSDIIRIPRKTIKGIILEKGGIAAHVAILARALRIPALMGVKNASKIIKNNNEIILDCYAKNIYVRPSNELKTQFSKLLTKTGKKKTIIDKNIVSTTKDNEKIILRSNISILNELPLLKKYSSEGIGLYRTEFLFMTKPYLPSEAQQFKAYKSVLQKADGNPVTIRSLDIGGDKPLPYLTLPKEENPALGKRGIRFLLSNPNILETQLRAILRAGVYGNLRILFPMITNETEILTIKKLLKKIENELKSKKVKYSEKYKIGIMLEVPAAIYNMDKLMQHVDFASIGSNDLSQYLFASDRSTNTSIDEDLCLHPTFLKVLSEIGSYFKKTPEKEISLCGEIAGNPKALPFILGAGIKVLSTTPELIPEIRKNISEISFKNSLRILNKALLMKDSREVISLIPKIKQSH